MDDYKDAIAACCKQLRLSVNLVENAMIQTGGSHQEYLYHLLRDEIQYRKSTRIAKLINTAGFPLHRHGSLPERDSGKVLPHSGTDQPAFRGTGAWNIVPASQKDG